MIDQNQQALLELLKASLFGAEPSFPEDVDWDAVLKEAQDQTVTALVASAVPPQEAAKWQISVARNKMRFLQILDEQTKLYQLFDDAGIPMAIIKGCAAAMYYPAPLNRTMGDIDFVVSSERINEANQLMTENGYQYMDTTQRHYDYVKNEIELELHHHYSDPDWDFENRISEGLSNVTLSEIYGKQFYTLPTEINGLVLLPSPLSDPLHTSLDRSISILLISLIPLLSSSTGLSPLLTSLFHFAYPLISPPLVNYSDL